MSLGTPLSPAAVKVMLLGSGELGKEVVIERGDLTEKVYEGDVGTDSNSLEVIVARLRRKIGRDAIETVRGRGYRLTAAPTT